MPELFLHGFIILKTYGTIYRENDFLTHRGYFMDEYQMEFSTGFGESFKDCPACGKEMVAGHSECFSCGVVVDRFRQSQLR